MSIMKTKLTKQTKGTLCAVVGGICWGFSGCCGQFLFSQKSIDSGWLTVVRLLSAGVILTLLAFFTNRDCLISTIRCRSDVIRILLFGVLGMMFCQFSYMNAIALTNAATATVIQYTGPVLVMVIVCLRARRLPTKREGISLLFAVGGTFLIATHGDIRSLVLSREGLLWCMLAAVSVVLYTLIPEKVIAKRSSTVVSGLGMTVGGIVLFFLVGAWKFSPSLDIEAILCIAAIVLIGTVVAFSLYLQAIADIGPVKASVIASIEPVSSAVIAFFWLGQKFAPLDLVGFVLIVSTVFLLAEKKKPAV